MELPKKVVIVEDELMSQRHITQILESLDIEVAGCYDNASDAKAGITKDSCDMILMDINIKGAEDGIQLTRSLLQQYHIPIVFISAYSDGETLEEVMELSPYGFVTKPFSAKDVEVALGIAYKRFLTDGHKMQSPTATQSSIQPVSNIVQISPKYYFDIEKNTLFGDEKPIKLNKKQLTLISVLSQRINQVVDYDTITEEAWPDGVYADSSLRTLVYSVRQMLPDLPIESHSKIGYSLNTID